MERESRAVSTVVSFFLKVRLSQYLESSQENLTLFQRRDWSDLKYLFFIFSKPTNTDLVIVYVFLDVILLNYVLVIFSSGNSFSD